MEINIVKYNFDEIINRRNTSSLKWDVKENELPMWVADMDFKTAPTIIDALRKRIDQGVYGYTLIPDEWYSAIIDFYKTRHNFEIKKEWLVFSLGVVPTISSSVRKMTSENDNIVVLSPVYNIFYNSIINNKRNVLEVELKYDGDNYSIDYKKLEEALSNEKTTMLIFCNPHNPVSKIWNKEDLIKVGALCKKYNVVVLSDEIHSEIVRPNFSYTPFISVSEENLNNTIMAFSPTKPFNMAGIQTSVICIPNEELRKKVVRQINTDEVAEPNVLSCIATIAAYKDSLDFLDELREYLFSNRDFASEYIKKEIPELKLLNGDATYLLWINIDRLNSDSETFASYLREKTGLIITAGKEYSGDGDHFIRMNVACSKKVLLDGLNRLKEGTKAFLNEKSK